MRPSTSGAEAAAQRAACSSGVCSGKLRPWNLRPSGASPSSCWLLRPLEVKRPCASCSSPPSNRSVESSKNFKAPARKTGVMGGKLGLVHNGQRGEQRHTVNSASATSERPLSHAASTSRTLAVQQLPQAGEPVRPRRRRSLCQRRAGGAWVGRSTSSVQPRQQRLEGCLRRLELGRHNCRPSVVNWTSSTSAWLHECWQSSNN